MTNQKKTLRERIFNFESALNDNQDVYCGSALERGKGLDKKNKALKNLADGSNDDVLVVVDSTVWGSVSEGFCITENYIYGKELYEDCHNFYIPHISSIHVDKGGKTLNINGVSIKWLGDSTTPKMEIIANCIKEHIDEISKVVVNANQGFEAHIKNLKDQISDLVSSTHDWDQAVSLKISEAESDYTMYGNYFGTENFLQKMSVSMVRSKAVDNFNKIKSEIEQKVSSLNNSVPIKHVNKIFKDEDLDLVDFNFNFEIFPDKDTSASNENWNQNMDDAFYQLKNLVKEIGERTKLIKSRLNEIEDEDED